MAGEAALNDYTEPAAANGIQVTRPRAAAAGGSTAFTMLVQQTQSFNWYLHRRSIRCSNDDRSRCNDEDGANMAAH